MIPLLLIGAGAYLIYDSQKPDKMAKGGAVKRFVEMRKGKPVYALKDAIFHMSLGKLNDKGFPETTGTAKVYRANTGLQKINDYKNDKDYYVVEEKEDESGIYHISFADNNRFVVSFDRDDLYENGGIIENPVFTFKTDNDYHNARSSGYIDDYDIVRIEVKHPSGGGVDFATHSEEEYFEALDRIKKSGAKIVRTYQDKMYYDINDYYDPDEDKGGDEYQDGGILEKGSILDNVSIREEKRKGEIIGVDFYIGKKAKASLSIVPLMEAIDYVPNRKELRREYKYAKKEKYLAQENLSNLWENVYYLDNLEVNPKYRGQGLSTILLKSIFRYCKKNKIKYIYLYASAYDVWDKSLNDQELKKYYERYGFVEIGANTMVKKLNKGGTLLMYASGGEIDTARSYVMFIDTLQDAERLGFGGKVKFKDKVKSISENLKGRKVPKRLQKEYGKTYDKKWERDESARRIAGSQLKRMNIK